MMKLMEITGTVEVYFDDTPKTDDTPRIEFNEDDGPLMTGYIRFRHGDMTLAFEGQPSRFDCLPDDEMLHWRICSGEMQAMDRENGEDFPVDLSKRFEK